jgi:two-component system invasion response regulator UvrY
VIVMDIAMPGIGGLEAIDSYPRAANRRRAFSCSRHIEDAMHARRVMKSGAVGYPHEAQCSRELIQAIRQVALGKTYLEPSIAQQLAMQHLNGQKIPLIC